MLEKIKQKIKEKSTNDKIVSFFIIASIILIVIFILQFFLYWILVTPNTPLNVVLFFQGKGDSFMDFFNVNYFVENNDPYVSGGSSYPPLTLLIAKFFALFANYTNGAKVARLTIGGIVSIILFVLIFYIFSFLLLKKYMKSKNTGKKQINLLTVIFSLSAPMLFVFQRGNYLMLTLLFTVFFFVFRNSSNKVLRELSYISLAAAVGTKLYPAIFAIILLKEKKIFAVAKAALYSAVLLTVPFLFFTGGFSNIPVFLENLLKFSNIQLTTVINDNTYIHSLSNNFSITHLLSVFLHFFLRFNFLNPPAWLNMLSNIVVFIFAFVILFAAFFSYSQWKSIAACSLGTIVLINPSYAYTAVFIFIPCIVFLLDKGKTKKDWFYMVLFLIILSPIQYGHVIKPLSAGLHYGTTAANFVQMCSLMVFVIALAVDAAGGLLHKLRQRNKTSNSIEGSK